MKVAVVGAGWYGCHIALSLKKKNFKVTVFEKEPNIFQQASGNNQNRLHAGFHYPRDHNTRMQTVLGFERFIKEYSFLTKEINNNYYLVSDKKSLLDIETYKLIMKSAGAWMEEVDVPDYLRGVSGAIKTAERVILNNDAKSYFESNLSQHINLCTNIKNIEVTKSHVRVNEEKFDYLIDCTWGHAQKAKNIFYEASLLLKVKRISGPTDALTFVDGNLCSLYPTQKQNEFTLSSVTHTPLKKSYYSDEIQDFVNNINSTLLEKQSKKIINHIEEYYESFLKNWKFQGFQISVKTKPVGESANRACTITNNGRLVQVMSGKIDTIFYASDKIIEILQ